MINCPQASKPGSGLHQRVRPDLAAAWGRRRAKSGPLCVTSQIGTSKSHPTVPFFRQVSQPPRQTIVTPHYYNSGDCVRLRTYIKWTHCSYHSTRYRITVITQQSSPDPLSEKGQFVFDRLTTFSVRMTTTNSFVINHQPGHII